MPWPVYDPRAGHTGVSAILKGRGSNTSEMSWENSDVLQGPPFRGKEFLRGISHSLN